MLRKMFSLFSCSHSRYTFPLTLRGERRVSAASHTGTFVTCLDCGKEIGYDWNEMKKVEPTLDKRTFGQLLRSESGQDIAEYAILAAVIIILVIATVRFVGKSVNGYLTNVNNAMTNTR